MISILSQAVSFELVLNSSQCKHQYDEEFRVEFCVFFFQKQNERFFVCHFNLEFLFEIFTDDS